MYRIDPQLPPQFYKTYVLSAPLATHFRPGSCEESNCDHYLGGWVTTVDEATPLGQRQAAYIRRESRRKFSEEKTRAGLTEFTFAAGQKCFLEHRVPNGRPEIYIEREGDHRGNPRGERRVHVRAADWVDSFAEHQDKLSAATR